MNPEEEIVDVQIDTDAFVYFEKGADTSDLETR